MAFSWGIAHSPLVLVGRTGASGHLPNRLKRCWSSSSSVRAGVVPSFPNCFDGGRWGVSVAGWGGIQASCPCVLSSTCSMGAVNRPRSLGPVVSFGTSDFRGSHIRNNFFAQGVVMYLLSAASRETTKPCLYFCFDLITNPFLLEVVSHSILR